MSSKKKKGKKKDLVPASESGSSVKSAAAFTEPGLRVHRQDIRAGENGEGLAALDMLVMMHPEDAPARSLQSDDNITVRMYPTAEVLGVGTVWCTKRVPSGTVQLGSHFHSAHQTTDRNSMVEVQRIDMDSGFRGGEDAVEVFIWPRGDGPLDIEDRRIQNLIRCTVVDRIFISGSTITLQVDGQKVYCSIARSLSEASMISDDALSSGRAAEAAVSPTKVEKSLEDIDVPSTSAWFTAVSDRIPFTVRPGTRIRLASSAARIQALRAAATDTAAVDSSADTSMKPTGIVDRMMDDTGPLSALGGMRGVIDEVLRVLELPLFHPDMFDQYGIRPPKGVLLHGPPGTGKTMLAKALSAHAKVGFYSINGAEVMGTYVGEAEEKLRDVFDTAARHAPAIVFIDEVDALCPEREDAGEAEGRIVATLLALLDGVEAHPQVVLLAATNRPASIDRALRRPGRLDREIAVGIPTAEGRLDIFKRCFRSYSHALTPEDIQAVARTTHGYVGADIAAVCREAALASVTRSIEASLSVKSDLTASASASVEESIISMHDLQMALKVVQPSALRELTVDVPSVRWADIGGQAEIKQALKEAVEWPLLHAEAFQRMGIKPPKGILLYGPPGCSKTMLAKAVATEGGMNFVAVKGPELFSKFVGDSEKAVRELFRKARMASPCVVFFDEIDALAAARGGDAAGGVGDRVVSQLLQELDGIHELKQVVVIAATNRPDMIDRALLRPGRIGRLLYVDLPDRDARIQIVQLQLAKMAHAEDVTAELCADSLAGYSGAEVVSVLREAALQALSEDMDTLGFSLRHVQKATSEVPKQITPAMLKFYETFRNKHR